MRVADIMTQDPITIAPDATVREAARRMDEEQLRHLPVVEEGHLVGLVSDRDLLGERGRLRPRVSDELDHGPATVADVMTGQPLSEVPDAMVAHAAARLVEFGIGSLPVARDRVLVGLVTEIDFLEAFTAACRYGRMGDDDPIVQTLMSRGPTTVGAFASLVDVVKTMEQQDMRHVPVVESGRLVGMVSDRDLRAAAKDGGLASTRAGDVLTADPVTATPDEPVSHAVIRMTSQKIGALPVVADGALVGILTTTDVLAHCAHVLEASEAAS